MNQTWQSRKWHLPAVLLLSAACAITIPRNEYGLEVIKSSSLYRRTVAADPSKELVDLARAVPNLLLDLRYAGPDNFMKRPLYPVARAFLRRPAAEALREAQRELEDRDLGLKVFDAYRPYSVTRLMWEPYKNPDFVADPAKGSRHNRGCAVDVTLVDRGGNELSMPTAYDDFTSHARHDYQDLPEESRRNRVLLREVMERHGFVALPSEWWHYDYRGWERFELLDLPLERLAFHCQCG